MSRIKKYTKLANLFDSIGYHDTAGFINAYLKDSVIKNADANDYLLAAERDVQEIAALVKNMPPTEDHYPLDNKLKELDYHLKMVRNEVASIKRSSLKFKK